MKWFHHNYLEYDCIYKVHHNDTILVIYIKTDNYIIVIYIKTIIEDELYSELG